MHIPIYIYIYIYVYTCGGAGAKPAAIGGRPPGFGGPEPAVGRPARQARLVDVRCDKTSVSLVRRRKRYLDSRRLPRQNAASLECPGLGFDSYIITLLCH